MIIAAPRTAFADNEKKLLSDFLDQGGRLLYLSDSAADTGLDPLLARYGIQIDNGIVADPKVRPEQPYIIMGPFFGDHPIVAQLKSAKMNLLFMACRALSQIKEGTAEGVVTLPLVLSSPSAWVETSPTDNPTLDTGEKTGQLPLVIASSRPVHPASNKRTDEARLVVFGDARVLTSTWSLEPNRNLVLNALAWTANQPKRITIRPPDRELSTLDIDAERLAAVRLVSMDLLPMLLIGVGLTIWLTRRSR